MTGGEVEDSKALGVTTYTHCTYPETMEREGRGGREGGRGGGSEGWRKGGRNGGEEGGGRRGGKEGETS